MREEMRGRPRLFDRSRALSQRCRVPQGLLDVARLGPVDVMPAFMARGQGVHVWDVDGNVYVDWVMGKGAVSLGHAHPAVDEPAARRAASGLQLGLCTPEYVELAERFHDLVPAAEHSIFLKTGSEAVQAAVRLARASTGRDVVLWCGYHGWLDSFVPPQAGARGAVASGLALDFGYDLDRLDQLVARYRGEVAALLVTPEPGFFAPDFLHRCCEAAESLGALFIVDEMRCGFRIAPGGAHAAAGVGADLVTYGKAFANGYPIAAVVGRAAVMEASRNTFLFSSHFCEAASVTAAIATLDNYAQHDVCAHMQRAGSEVMRLLDGIFVEVGIPARCLGPASMFHILFESEPAERTFFAEAAQEGALFFPKDNQCPALLHDDPAIRATARGAERAACAVRAQHYGNRRTPPGEVCPEALARYEQRRLIAGGCSDRHQIERNLQPP